MSCNSSSRFIFWAFSQNLLYIMGSRACELSIVALFEEIR